MKKRLSNIIVFTLIICLSSTAAWAGKAKTSVKITNPVAKVSINPQPEPPGSESAKFVTPVVKKGFNPQPEPPAAGKLFKK